MGSAATKARQRAEFEEPQQIADAICMLRPHLRANRKALIAFHAEHKNRESRVSTLAADIILHIIVPYVAEVSARNWGDDIFTRNAAALAAYEYDRYISGHTVHSRALPHLCNELSAARVDIAQPTMLVKGLPSGIVEIVWNGRYPYYYLQLPPDRVATIHDHLHGIFSGKKVMPICTLPCGLILYCVVIKPAVTKLWLLLDPETLVSVQVLAPDPGRPIQFGQFLIDDYGHLVACDCSKLYGFSKYTMMYAHYKVPT